MNLTGSIKDRMVLNTFRQAYADDSLQPGDTIVEATSGISSGCNLLAALEAQDLLSPSSIAITIFCDDNKKYLSTDLLRDIPTKAVYLSPYIDFLGFRSLPRCF